MKNYNFKNIEDRKKFYISKEWRELRQIKLSLNPLCEWCEKNGLITPAVDIHHNKELVDYPSLALDLNNLTSLCKDCHTKHTVNEYNNKNKKVKDKIYNSKWKI